MKKKTFYQTISKLRNGKIRKNPLLPNEFHLVKSMLQDKDVECVTVYKMEDHEDQIVNYF